MRAAGFAQTGVEHCRAEPQPIDAAYLRKVEDKFISTYALLPPKEYAAGLERLRAAIRKRGQLDTPVVWESVTVWGVRE